MRMACRRAGCGLVVAHIVMAVAGCAADTATVRTIEVPADEATITAAVDAARPGDTIVIAPGVYAESVRVDVPRITIRGEDRNDVVLDGGHALSNGFLVAADDVAIENLTVHSYTQNGVVFSGIEAVANGGAVDPETVYGAGDDVLRGYRVSHVTAFNNGLYGIYAFASRDGLIEHSYVSGHPDSGIYIGQCKPCNAVVRSVVAERNAIGYYGTNASGGVYVIESVFRGNRLGIAPNSQDAERLAPQEDTVVAGNLVADNDDPTAPEIPDGYFGVGIAVGGGTSNVIVRNRVVGNDGAGIALVSLGGYLPLSNRIEGNVVEANGIDLAYAPGGAVDGGDNCFDGNRFGTSLPDALERLLPCGSPPMTFEIPALILPVAPDDVDYRTLPPPPPQSSMPTPPVGTVAGAGSVPAIDVDVITVPER